MANGGRLYWRRAVLRGHPGESHHSGLLSAADAGQLLRMLQLLCQGAATQCCSGRHNIACRAAPGRGAAPYRVLLRAVL